MSIILVFALYVCWAGLGIWPVRWLAGDRLSPGERLACAFAVGMTVMQYAIWGVGAVRYDAASMAVLLAATGVAAVPGLIVLWRQRPRLVGLDDSVVIVVALLVTVLGVHGVIDGLAPPSDYDTLLYHLSLPRLDLELGRIALDPQRGDLEFFPQLNGMQARLMLALTGYAGAQVVQGGMAILAAAVSALLVLRMGGRNRAAWLAALFFLAVRTVVWESGSAMIDISLAVFGALVLVVVLAWSERPSVALAALGGVLLGGMMCAKYTAVLFALATAVALLPAMRGRRHLAPHLAVAALMALMVVLPYLVRNGLATGNPLFPMLGSRDAYASSEGFAASRLVVLFPDAVRALWKIFISPNDGFDGQQFGAPYLLMFAPLAALCWRDIRGKAPVLTAFAAFYGLWALFPFTLKQARFLFPLFPVMCALAAFGATALWDAVAPTRAFRFAFLAVAAVVAANQAAFIGVYGLLRVPAALGRVAPETYLTTTPTFEHTHYDTCRWLEANLKPGERWLDLLDMPSFYCPQASRMDLAALGDGGPPPRWIAVVTAMERRGNAAAAPRLEAMLGSATRDPVLNKALSEEPAVFTGIRSAIYDAGTVFAHRAAPDGRP